MDIGKNAISKDESNEWLEFISDLTREYAKRGAYLAPNMKIKSNKDEDYTFDNIFFMILGKHNLSPKELKEIFHQQKMDDAIGCKILTILRNTDEIKVADNDFKLISKGEITESGRGINPWQDLVDKVVEYNYPTTESIGQYIQGIEMNPFKIVVYNDDNESQTKSYDNLEKTEKKYMEEVILPILQEYDSKVGEIYLKLFNAYCEFNTSTPFKNDVKKLRDKLYNLEKEGKLKLPNEIRKNITEIVDSIYEGKSFPVFPGIINGSKTIPYANEVIYYINPIGKGWNRNNNILRRYLKLKKDLEELNANEEDTKILELIADKLNTVLIGLGLNDLSFEEYELLFSSEDDVNVKEDNHINGAPIQTNQTQTKNNENDTRKPKSSNKKKEKPPKLISVIINNTPNKLKSLIEDDNDYKYKIRIVESNPKPMTYKISIKSSIPEEQPEDMHIFIRERGTKYHKRDKLIEEIDEYVPAIQELFSIGLANSLTIPKGKIYIHYNTLPYDFYEFEGMRYGDNKKDFEFMYLVKSMIDSAILYLNYADKSFASKLNGTYFEYFQKNNEICLFNNLQKDTKNSLIHDYYYNLRDGLWAYQKLEGILQDCHKKIKYPTY